MDYTTLQKMYPELIILENEPLSKYTYTKTGGPAQLLFQPKSTNEIIDIVKWAKDNNYPLNVIGNGSNILIRDGGINGVTIILTMFKNIEVKRNKIVAQSGASLIKVSNIALKKKLSGIEFACGIPGTVGGAVYMNAGAYGGEVKNIIQDVTLLMQNGNVIKLSNEEMEFGYRKSKLMNDHNIVLEVTFLLTPGSYLRSKIKIWKFSYLRATKQPLNYPSCGSVFKDSPNHYTGRLIKEMGLQGKTIGGAQISKKHPNFIVNVDNATTTDYIELISYIKRVVYQRYGYHFEVEPVIIGEEVNTDWV